MVALGVEWRGQYYAIVLIQRFPSDHMGICTHIVATAFRLKSRRFIFGGHPLVTLFLYWIPRPKGDRGSSFILGRLSLHSAVSAEPMP